MLLAASGCLDCFWLLLAASGCCFSAVSDCFWLLFWLFLAKCSKRSKLPNSPKNAHFVYIGIPFTCSQSFADQGRPGQTRAPTQEATVRACHPPTPVDAHPNPQPHTRTQPCAPHTTLEGAGPLPTTAAAHHVPAADLRRLHHPDMGGRASHPCSPLPPLPSLSLAWAADGPARTLPQRTPSSGGHRVALSPQPGGGGAGRPTPSESGLGLGGGNIAAPADFSGGGEG